MSNKRSEGRKEAENFNTVTFIDEVLKREADSAEELKSRWWQIPERFRLKRWKNTLDNFCLDGYTLWDVARCIGVNATPNGKPSFYRSLPDKYTYVKIGILFQQSRKTIDYWIKKNCKSRTLYTKDITDLIWVFLIELSHTLAWERYARELKEGRCTIDDIYKRFHSAALTTYKQCSYDPRENASSTITIDNLLHEAISSCNTSEEKMLSEFISQHYSSFSSAFQKQRKLEIKYIQIMMSVLNVHALDDFLQTHMNLFSEFKVRYITQTGNEWKKYIMKKRSSYISLGLALGMTLRELNAYLDICGYDALQISDKESGELMLILGLKKWEKLNPEQREFKEKYLFNIDNGSFLSDKAKPGPFIDTDMKAVEQMLSLKEDLQKWFTEEGLEFPFS